MNEVFTQVLELARSVGMGGRLRHVAIDSTRIAVERGGRSVETEEKLGAADKAANLAG